MNKEIPPVREKKENLTDGISPTARGQWLMVIVSLRNNRIYEKEKE